MEVPEESFHWSSWDSRTGFSFLLFGFFFIYFLMPTRWLNKKRNKKPKIAFMFFYFLILYSNGFFLVVDTFHLTQRSAMKRMPKRIHIFYLIVVILSFYSHTATLNNVCEEIKRKDNEKIEKNMKIK